MKIPNNVIEYFEKAAEGENFATLTLELKLHDGKPCWAFNKFVAFNSSEQIRGAGVSVKIPASIKSYFMTFADNDDEKFATVKLECVIKNGKPRFRITKETSFMPSRPTSGSGAGKGGRFYGGK